MNRFIKYMFPSVLALLATAAPVSAQMSHARIDELNESRDLRVDVIRKKMDRIRATRKRPTVALVLSGGGAKGAAHVGVIRYLESIGLPVDIVMGTSMGGLVGGIYALGYDAPHLDSLVRSIDWDMALSDKVPRDYLSYSTNKYKEKYVLSFPFYYNREDFKKQREDELQYPHRSEDIRFGADGNDASSLVKDNLMGSLPSGMVYGQNVTNIFSAVSVGYQDEIDFYEDLPIPFLCVATDLVTGTAKIWTKGKLNTALRSTMSIPGLFTPVKVDGMVLVDGGMRNNFPTDLAKKCGADIVIGVNLSSGYKDYSQINNLGDVIGTSIDMMGRTSFEVNQNIPDVSIIPDLHEYGMLSFDTESIATIIDRGYEAALSVSGQLDSIKAIIGEDETVLNGEPADDIRLEKVMVSGVEIVGVSDKESAYLQNKIKIAAGTMMGREEIEDAVATIFGTNSFDYVNYELLGDSQPYRLKFNCKKGPISKVGVGARFDTEEVVAVIMNIGWGVQKLQGASWDIVGKVGTNPFAGVTYSYVAKRGMSVNASASIRYSDRNSFSTVANNYTVNILNRREEFYISNLKWSKLFMKAGVRNEFFRIGSVMSEKSIWNSGVNKFSEYYLSAFVNGRNDNMDNAYVPTTGHSIGVSYSWTLGGFPKEIDRYHVIQFDSRRVFGGDRFAFIPSVNIRAVLGEDVPIPFMNTMGGSIAGRYFDQQMPFIGFGNSAVMSNILGVGRADLRVKLYRNNYLTAIYNYALTSDSFKGFEDWDDHVLDYHGCGLQYTYNSIVGPLCINVHWSDYTRKTGYYVSIGFDF